MIAWIPLLGAAALASEPGFPFEVHTSTLENGLTVHVVPMGTPDVAAVYTWFAVGSRDEIDPGRTGFAHFFEHLAFYGTPTTTGSAREQHLLRMGAEDNAWTWLDETVYHTVLPARDVPRFLAIEADRFAHLHLTPADVQKEAGAVYGEFRKSQADPGSALSNAVMAAAFTTHTYGHDTLGYEADIAAMPDAHPYATAFFDRFYRPDNATVIVAGDVDPDAITAAVTEHWASWEPAAEPRPEIPAEPEQTELRRVSVDWPSPTAPILQMSWKIPASNAQSADVAALQAAADVLFASVGPLQQRLVREEGIAYAVSGWRGDTVDPGVFTVTVTCKEPAGIATAEAIVREELGRLGQIDPALLDRTRSHERYRWLTGLEDPGSVADNLGWFLRRHGDPASYATWWTLYDSLTPEQIGEVGARTFVDEHLTIGVLMHGPTPEGE